MINQEINNEQVKASLIEAIKAINEANEALLGLFNSEDKDETN
jgi:hypothetical protein